MHVRITRMLLAYPSWQPNTFKVRRPPAWAHWQAVHMDMGKA